MRTSLPRRIPPSTYTSHRSPAAIHDVGECVAGCAGRCPAAGRRGWRRPPPPPHVRPSGGRRRPGTPPLRPRGGWSTGRASRGPEPEVLLEVRSHVGSQARARHLGKVAFSDRRDVLDAQALRQPEAVAGVALPVTPSRGIDGENDGVGAGCLGSLDELKGEIPVLVDV